MKYIIVVLSLVLAGCGQYVETAPPVEKVVKEEMPEKGCLVKTSSKLVTEHKVSDILNLVKDIDPNGSCTVKFDLIVNGETYHLEETESGYEQIPSLCHYAKERARRDLLLELGGHFQSETSVVCRELNG
jgi:hypothetical protein